MSTEIFATRLLLANEFIDGPLPEPLVFERRLGRGEREVLVLRWPDASSEVAASKLLSVTDTHNVILCGESKIVCQACVYVAHKTGYIRDFKEDAVYFEIFGANQRKDACGPLFAKLADFLDCDFVAQYGNVVTAEDGVDSDDWDTELHDQAIKAIEARPGALTPYFGNTDPDYVSRHRAV